MSFCCIIFFLSQYLRLKPPQQTFAQKLTLEVTVSAPYLKTFCLVKKHFVAVLRILGLVLTFVQDIGTLCPLSPTLIGCPPDAPGHLVQYLIRLTEASFNILVTARTHNWIHTVEVDPTKAR